MTLDFAVQYAVDRPDLPQQSELREWALAALTADANAPDNGGTNTRARYSSAEITVRIVDEAESAALNHSYRGKTGATNVLAFPLPLDQASAAAEPALASRLLGDLVLCAPVVVREALAQGKPLSAHWAHLVVHGVLHLLGYDHQQQAHATLMEQREARILTTFGYPDPYGELAPHD